MLFATNLFLTLFHEFLFLCLVWFAVLDYFRLYCQIYSIVFFAIFYHLYYALEKSFDYFSGLILFI